MKTQAMRLLDGKKILYSVLTYPDVEKDAEQIAEILELSPDAVFKTLVIIRSSSKPLLVMVPANKRVDLKKVAAAVGDKKVKMALHREAEALTGLQVGGISALALINQRFTPLLDQSALKLEQMYVSAGKRGIQIGLRPRDFIALTQPKIIDAAAPA